MLSKMICGAAALLSLTACSQEDIVSGGALPEGGIPLADSFRIP